MKITYNNIIVLSVSQAARLMRELSKLRLANYFRIGHICVETFIPVKNAQEEEADTPL